MADVKLPPGATLVKSPTMNAAPSAPSTPPNIKLPQGATLTKSSVPNAAQGAAVPASPPAAAPALTMADEQRAAVASARAYKPTFDDFMKGAESWARGASFGTSDDASAGLAAAILKAKGDPRAMGEIYKQLDTAENARIDDYEKKNGSGAEVLGMFTGPGLARIGQFIGRGANWLARGGRAALAGAGTGAVADVGYADPDKKLDPKRTATAAGIGAAVGPLVQGATEVVAPALSAAAQRMIAGGMRPRVGQLMGGAAKTAEEKLADTVPLLGDVMNSQQRASVEQFNRMAYNNVLEPIGAQVAADQAVGHEGYRVVKDTLDDHFADLLPRLTLRVDPHLQRAMSTVDMMADALPTPQREAYIRTMNAQFADKLSGTPMGGTLDGNTFKTIESELGDRAARLSNDPSVDQQDLGRVYTSALQAFRDVLEHQNPAYAPQLRALNSAYARFTRLRDATARIGAHDGVFTPQQLLSAARRMDRSRGHGRFSEGDALMQGLAEDANQVIGGKYPNSGTAGRLLLSGAVGGALGAGAHFEPHTAAGLAATTIPYLPGVRNWFSSPMSQSAGALLRQINPALAGQAPRALRHDGGIGQRYIGETRDVPRVTMDQGTPVQ